MSFATTWTGFAAFNPKLAAHYTWGVENWPAEDGACLHLGCGSKLLDGFVNLDFLPSNPKVVNCNLLNIWPERLIGRTSLVYSEDVLEHFGLNEQIYLLCSMNLVLRPGAISRVLMPNIDILWRYKEIFDLDTLLANNDYLACVLGCRSGTDAFNMGMRMGGHRWLHNREGFARIARACGFNPVASRCDTSLDPRMNGINIRGDDSFAFAIDLVKQNALERLIIPPLNVRQAEQIEEIGSGQNLWRAIGSDPSINYDFPAIPVEEIACLNVRSANISEFREHNFSKAYFALKEGHALYVDRTLLSAPHMNPFSTDDLYRALQQRPLLEQLRFNPSKSAGDLFTVGPLEIFRFTRERDDG
ncbi:MAG: hypothetical protein WCF85_12190 [Rhodospirillaceae bacterium]